MKKRIAVLANGWNNYSITKALRGIKSCTDKLNIDVFLFLSFAAFSQSQERNQGEDKIFDLPNFEDFDGVIVFSAMLNSQQTPLHIAEVLSTKKVPAVSIGMDLPGMDSVCIENFNGMYAMVDHLAKEHHIKRPVFMAGPKTNHDSNERFEAASLALKDNGLSFLDVKNTNWEYLTSRDMAIELANSELKPDAYICANDHIAIAVCIGLEQAGVRVPEDAVVTGFDRIAHAETFYPSITTVYQNYEKIGYIAAWHLLERLEGHGETHRIEVSSDYLRNESCGCKQTAEADYPRHVFCRDAYRHEMENIIFQIHTSDISKVLINCTSIKAFKRNIEMFYGLDHSYEGNDFCFILDTNAVKSFNDSGFPMKKTYSDKMHCLVCINDGHFEEFDDFEKEKLLPSYKKKDKPMMYAITSLHFDDYLYGYIVMGNCEEHIEDTSLNHYMLQMNSNLERYRQNCYLDEMNRALKNISIKDPLTGLYNRLGMEQICFPMFEESKKQNKKCAIMFADINRMKHINDDFGHLQGDLAIRTVSSTVLEKMPEGWMGIRYGGDEFISVGECNNEKIVTEFIEKVNEALAAKVSGMHLSYLLTISCGYIITEPGSDKLLVDYINEADSVMYVQKQKTYEKENYKRK